MNENPEKHLLDQIDQRVHQGQGSGDATIDGLAASVPRSNPAFQQRLEDELMCYFQTDGEREAIMTTMTTVRHAEWGKGPVLPLTLVAAMLALVLVASVLTFANRPSNNTGIVAAAVTQTGSPTPQSAFRILVAYQNLPRGFQFPTTVDELANYVGYVDWPLDMAPMNAIIESEESSNKLLGQYLYADVVREQPILTNMVVSDLTDIAPETTDLLRPVVIAQSDLAAGSQIERPAEQLAIVYWPSSLIPEGAYENPADLLGLYVKEDIAQWQPVFGVNVQAEAPVLMLPTNKVAVTIPVNLIAAVPYWFKVGDVVDIRADIIFVDVDPQFQELPGATVVFVTPNSQSQEVIVNPAPMGSATPANYQHIVQVIAREAEVLSIQPMEGNATVTLAVSPQEAQVLTWAVESGMPLSFSLSTDGEATPEATTNP